MASETGLVGIELPEVYDGVSVWQHPDGRMENRWSAMHKRFPKDRSIAWRYEQAQRWIESQSSERTQ